MADKKSGKKYQFAVFGLCSLIAMLACMAVLVITVKNIDSGSTNIAPSETLSKTELTDDTNVLLNYLKALTEKTSGNKFIKADIYTDISVDDSTVTVNGSEADKKLLIYAKNKMLPTVDSYYQEDFHGIFGTAYEDMPIIDLKALDIVSSSFSIGEADENGNPVYNTDTGELIDGDYYFINLFINQNKSTEKLFSLENKNEIAEKLSKDLLPICKINSSEISVAKLKITAKVNRFTDEIQYINLQKIYNISADVSFINELEFFGGKELDFEYTVNEKFEYSYAGISFSQKSVTVEPDKETALTVNAVIEDNSDYTVTFTSSDSSVATVDEMGYVKGIKQSCSPVTITVTLEYLGEMFTDECTVIVSDTNNPNG